MKVVLVVLSGAVQPALDSLAVLYPESAVELISRNEFETGSLMTRLAALRARGPDVFAIGTESLSWQRGQELFMLFGAMAGAREVVVLDAHGRLRKDSRGSLILQAPLRLASEAAKSASAVARARQELARLEREVANRTSPARARISDGQLRITYLRATPGPGTQAGGAASHIKGVIEGLLELGTEVQVISNDDLVGLDPAKVRLTKIETKLPGSTRAVFDINNNAAFTHGATPLIEQSPPDFIYQRYARFSWAGVVASLATGRPLFLEYNGSEVWVGRHWDRVSNLDLLKRYERLNLAAASRIFVVSEVDRTNLEQAGVAPEKIIVNSNGVDTEVFRPNVGGAEVRAGLGLSHGELLVGFVGSFGPWHGVLVLAEAIKMISVSLPLKFLLVGDGALQGQMKQMLDEESAGGRVIFKGSVDHKEVPALLDACDILVSPHIPLAAGAEFFGSPTKLFEYMAMGKGIVASRLGQIGEVLTDGQTALLVEPGNAHQLRDAILRLAEAPELRETLGKRARQVAIERHTWKRNAQKIIDVFTTWSQESRAQ